MNILFLLADFPGKGKANVNIAYKLQKAFQDKGYTVYIYGQYPQKNNYTIPLSRKSRFFCFLFNKGILNKCIRILIKSIFILTNKKLSYNIIYDDIIQHVPNIIENNKILKMIIFSAPFELNEVLLKNQIDIDVYSYMLDPNFSNYQNSDKRQELEEKEYQIMSKVNKIFTTNLIYKDYENSKLLKKYTNKIKIVEFPNVDNIEYLLAPNKNDIIISYIGNLYYDIRNPDSIIKLFNNLDINNLQLNFYGELYNFPKKYKEKTMIKYPFVKFYSSISKLEVKNVLNNSNFLLNIGNTVPNQMPSKIIEYINTGKSIINYYVIEKCPTLLYTLKYENALNIFKDEINQREIETFINTHSRKQIDKNKIRQIFKECTIEYVSNLVIQELKER